MSPLARNQNARIPERIASEADLRLGLAALSKIDPNLAPFIEGFDDIDLRWCPAGFEGLAQVIIGQQVSRASASAMKARLAETLKPFDAATCLKKGEKPLVKAGLSRAKQSTLLILAREMVENGLKLDALAEKPADEAIVRLVSLKGIGPWTAEVFLMFSAGHCDIFPSGDIALQQAMVDIGMEKVRPDSKRARELASRWSPVRSVAARVLWAVYARKRKRAVVPL